jgi:hypothetical protein
MKVFNFRNIDNIRTFYLVVLPTLLMVLLCSVFFLIVNCFVVKSDIQEVLSEQNSRARFALMDSLNYTKFVTASIGKQISINYSSRKKFDYDFVANLLAAYRDSSNQIIAWSTFSWADKNYNLLVSSNIGVVKKNTSVAERDYIGLTQRYPGQIHFGKPVIGIISKAWSIPAGYGVVDRRQEYLGAVITGVILEGLRNRIATSVNNPAVVFALVDKYGKVLTKSQAFDLNVAKDFLPKISTLQNVESFAEGNFFYQKLDEYPYGIITFYNDDALGWNSEYMNYYLMIMPLFTLIVILIFQFIYRDFISPIAQISSAAERVVRGEKLIEKMPHFKIREIRHIAKMVSLLEKSKPR